MAQDAVAALVVHFSKLEDPRVDRTKKHPLINIIVIGLCAVICGAQSFTEMEEFGKAKREWLSKFLDLSNGIPSHDTFNAVFARLDPVVFEQCLLSWIQALEEVTDGQIMSVDGKTLRGSYDRSDNKAAIHMVTVWATTNHLALGSRVVDQKSNEITAIPKLLELIDVSGALVTIDAIGCQKEIAQKIREEGADYVLAVKKNQPKLYEAVSSVFSEVLSSEVSLERCRTYRTVERGHGREDDRFYCVVRVAEDFPLKDQWKDLRALGVVISYSERDGGESGATRYYILSRYLSAKRFAEAVRGHWGIENHLHWHLDVTFGEDDLRIRKGHAPANMSILMRTALSLLKREGSLRRGIATKRKRAGWDTAYLTKVLTSHQR